MWLILLFPVVVSFLLLGAHFLHHGSVALMVVSVAIPLILLVRRWQVARVVQILLLLAALEWIRTAWDIVDGRITRGEPWIRTVVILGFVALWTVCSAILFETRTLRRRYRRLDSVAGASPQNSA